jgi:hypothetical protein
MKKCKTCGVPNAEMMKEKCALCEDFGMNCWMPIGMIELYEEEYV